MLIIFVNVGGGGLLVYYILPTVYFHSVGGVSCWGCCGGCCESLGIHGVGYVWVVVFLNIYMGIIYILVVLW